MKLIWERKKIEIYLVTGSSPYKIVPRKFIPNGIFFKHTLNDSYVTRLKYGRHRHLNHPPIDHAYKCHENTNDSRVSQLSKAPIHTSKLKYVPDRLQA